MSTPPKTITSAANPAVKRLKSLSVKKYRDEEGIFIVEGARHVGEALAAGWQADTAAFSAPDPLLQKLSGAALLEVTGDILSRITGRDNPQPLIAAFKKKEFTLSDIKDGSWVGLEGIRDPGNLGTILRTADAAGATGVLLIGDTCDPWSPEAVRATMESFARIKVARATLPAFLDWKKSYQGRVVGTHLHADVDYRAAQYTAPLLLLMGSEQAGLSEPAAKACDALVKIPMTGGAESLNLAVSTGIMLYEACRDRL